MDSLMSQRKRFGRSIEEVAKDFSADRIPPSKKHATDSTWFDRGSSSPQAATSSSVITGSTYTNVSNSLDRITLEEPFLYLTSLLELLSTHESNDAVRQYCSTQIRHLEPALLGYWLLSRTTEVCLAGMQRHAATASVQIECCRLLHGTLSRQTIHSQACLGACMYSMLVHLQDEAVQIALLEVLRLIGMHGLPTRVWFHVLPSLMHVLTNHTGSVAIQQVGLSILADLLCENELCRGRIPDGVSLLLQVMRLHPEDSVINCNAAAAVCWLIHTGPATGRAFVQKNIQVVLTCLGQHLENVSVFGNIVCVLCGLVMSMDEERIVMKMVGRGMQLHQTSSKVQESCLRWMRFRQLSNCHDEVLETIPTILLGMQAHLHDTHLQCQACDVLSILLEVSSDMKTSLTDHGVADVIISLLAAHKLDEQVQQGALLLMSLLLPRRGEDEHAFGGDFRTIEAVWGGQSMRTTSDE